MERCSTSAVAMRRRRYTAVHRYRAAVARKEPAARATGLPTGGAPDLLRAFALPALLVIIAGIGVFRSVTLDQSSWQGVSFGMFARYDNSTSRVVHVTVDRPEGRARVGLPRELGDDADRLLVVPTDDAARRLASAVLDRVQSSGARSVVVEVWRLHLRPEGGHLRVTRQRLVGGEAAR